jgi:hypothetical protein
VLCVVLGLWAGCPAPAENGSEPISPGRSGGSSGSGGSVSTGGTSATGGTTGTGGSVSTGGTSATGGATGTGGSPATGTGGGTADAGGDVPSPGTGGTPATPGDAGGGDTGGSNEFGDVSLPGKPWIRLCAKDATQAQCCDLLCRCLNKHCADSPADQANIAKCSNLCMGYSNMAMRCHVYHCFESLNPNVTKDHVSHCGHASNRVGGGGCPAPVYQ